VVLVTRGLVEAISKDSDTPFQVYPTLGGRDSLRGFSQDRFFGDARVLANLEARVRLFTLRLFGVTSEFQAAPFVDIGRVINQLEDLSDRVEVTPGLGLRGLVAPSVVGHIEVGVSREGPAIYVGLDYPF
jgi:hemolysin activation/secretion protein